MHLPLIPLSLLVIVTSALADTAPKPLFDDPNYHGSCDPEIIHNPVTGEWNIYYTARRALRKDGNVAAACPIGVASSRDWRTWTFKGYCRFDGKDDQPDASHTYWAPAVAIDGDTMHMYVTFSESTEGFWGGDSKGIRHYTAKTSSPMDWISVDKPLDDPEAIDAGLIKKDEQWLMYYRDKAPEGKRGATTRLAVSTDFKKWEKRGLAMGEVNEFKVRNFGYQEAQYPFKWKDSYWLLTDPSGPAMAIYQSEDALDWQYNNTILDQPGKHRSDKSFGRHPSVAVVSDRAFIFYHCEPDREYKGAYPQEKLENRQCYLQIAELKLTDDGRITCARDAPVDLPSAASLAK